MAGGRLGGKASRHPLQESLAGGLDPENVSEAIEVARPEAVDVASGVESEPGVKEHSLMARFIEAAQDAAVVAE